MSTTWGTVYRIRAVLPENRYLYRGPMYSDLQSAERALAEFVRETKQAKNSTFTHEIVTWVKYPNRPGVAPRAANTTIQVVRTA